MYSMYLQKMTKFTSQPIKRLAMVCLCTMFSISAAHLEDIPSSKTLGKPYVINFTHYISFGLLPTFALDHEVNTPLAVRKTFSAAKASASKDFSSVAFGYNGKIAIKCFLYLQTFGSPKITDTIEMTCFLDTVGCTTWLSEKEGQLQVQHPPTPAQQLLCLAKTQLSSVNVGNCECTTNSDCKCYCIGTLCNTKYVYGTFLSSDFQK